MHVITEQQLADFLKKTLLENGYDFSNQVQTQLLRYLTLLQQWNRVFNLTAIHDPKDMVKLHLLDSFTIHTYLHGQRILDVGTGAGLPGIPLALIYPDKKFVLLDSNSKKTHFLTQVLLELNLKNVEVIHARCEEYRPETLFDSIVSRAFASIKVMLTTTQHLIGEEGLFLSMKGVYPEQELNELPHNFTIFNIHPLKIIGLDAARCLVVIKKRSQ